MKTTPPLFMPLTRAVALTLVLASTLATLHAHFVWIEDTPDEQLVIRFGYPGEKHETSPGRLDRLSQPVAWRFGADAKPVALATAKMPDHFLCLGASVAEPMCAETMFPVRGEPDEPGTRPHFLMRWLPAGPAVAATPSLTLDLVPTGEPGVFQLSFNGQPLPETRVVVRPPGAQGQETKSDAQGLVRYTSVQPGLHLIAASHRVPVAGFAGGRAFARTSYNASVAWRQP